MLVIACQGSQTPTANCLTLTFKAKQKQNRTKQYQNKHLNIDAMGELLLYRKLSSHSAVCIIYDTFGFSNYATLNLHSFPKEVYIYGHYLLFIHGNLLLDHSFLVCSLVSDT